MHHSHQRILSFDEQLDAEYMRAIDGLNKFISNQPVWWQSAFAEELDYHIPDHYQWYMDCPIEMNLEDLRVLTREYATNAIDEVALLYAAVTEKYSNLLRAPADVVSKIKLWSSFRDDA